jgi:hypothetical protein
MNLTLFQIFFETGTIDRIYAVSPREAEKFYLRMLFYHVARAAEHKDLRTVDGIVYPNFQSAPRARHLLMDDEHWELCMSDAVHSQTPFELRHLFAIIIAFSEPSDLFQLRKHFAEDYLHCANVRLRGVNDAFSDITEFVEPTTEMYDNYLLDISDILDAQSMDLFLINGFVGPINDSRRLYRDEAVDGPDYSMYDSVIEEQLMLTANPTNAQSF